MEISGKVIQLLPLQSGEGKNGRWQKQEFIIEVPGQFAKKVCLSLWGDKVNQNPVKVGDTITASFDLESREFNNRWYTEARAWKIAQQGQPATHPGAEISSPSADAFSSLTDKDIPGNDNFKSSGIDDDQMPF